MAKALDFTTRLYHTKGTITHEVHNKGKITCKIVLLALIVKVKCDCAFIVTVILLL